MTSSSANYKPSKFADQVRSFLESSYDSYINVVALLAVAEEFHP
jgi:hypothetical protein